MSFEDITLQCVACGENFEFTAGEQSYFEERGLNSPPKRCKKCRQEAKKRKRQQRNNQFGGEYRSPAFDTSAPSSVRGRRNRGKFQTRNRFDKDYRSPSFRNAPSNTDGEYRSPAFKEQEDLNPNDEYRSPGFKEYENISPEEEYRSPAFNSGEERYQDEKPMFSITCVACGEDAMVPFLPEEKEDPMCPNCYKEHKELLKKEREQEKALAIDTDQALPPETKPSSADETDPPVSQSE